MSEKEKSKPTLQSSKHIPKDGQVIMAIMKEMGIMEYEPKTIVQLTEFVYRYATTVLEEARMFANKSKKAIDCEDVRLALQLSSESSFTTPPPRESILELARNKNNSPLPLVKPHCGLRLPPDRYCLATCNYVLKSGTTKRINKAAGSGIKIIAKPTVSYIKRSNPTTIGKQAVTIPKTMLKPKIQLQTMTTVAADGLNMDVENSLKRKREDDDEFIGM